MLFSACDNSSGSDDDFVEAPTERQFIWEAMNYWYFWQNSVPVLADNREFFEGNDRTYHEYLNSFESPQLLFQDVQNASFDDFSFFIEDYNELNKALKGAGNSFGFEFGLVRFNNNDDGVFGFVQYVLPGSPADNAGLERGDLFLAIDNIFLTVTNFSFLLSQPTYNLTMGVFSDNNTIAVSEERISVTAVPFEENPIFLSTVIERENVRIGYLMYNSFRLSSHNDLNQAFGQFAAQNIDELIIDVRYNSGGTLVTSALIASMVSGLGTQDKFGELAFNSKRAAANNSSVFFLNTVPLYNDNDERIGEVGMNTLNLDRVYIITGQGSASASETLINGLTPYIDAQNIGVQTIGKDEGSFVLYDAPVPFTNKDDADQSHTFAIQPIILSIVNSLGMGYPTGLPADFAIDELDFLDNLGELGDVNEPLLAATIARIEGQQPVAKASNRPPIGTLIFSSAELKPTNQRIYILPEQINFIDQ
ncbi:MAG: S41 family peptidase [Bacteroidota bacterium]